MIIVIPMKKRTALIMLFLLLGLAIGMKEHLYQDSLAYSREGFMDNVVYVEEHGGTPLKEAICLIVYNDNSKCNKWH